MTKEETQQVNIGKRKAAALFVFAVLAVAGVASVFFYMQYKSTHISTDDAFIEGNIHTIASKVPGTVRKVHVSDNQLVRKGDLILELDAADFDARTSEADAGLHTEHSKLAEASVKVETAQRQMSELNHRLEAAKANLELQEANLRQADADMKRAENLFRKEAISKERHEKVRTAYDVAFAQVKTAIEQVKQAEIAVKTQEAVIRQSESGMKAQEAAVRKGEAILKTAELNRSYTKLYAPSSGQITRKSVQPGNQVQPGQPLMAVVPLDNLWVIGNYKETQLTDVKPGQKVKIRVDTYPDRDFEGKVDSIMAGTGSAFSLFPPENATGNFVKVVQRIPVKIVLDKDTDAAHILRVGMSVEPTVIVK